jgi:hypothetical protein
MCEALLTLKWLRKPWQILLGRIVLQKRLQRALPVSTRRELSLLVLYVMPRVMWTWQV